MTVEKMRLFVLLAGIFVISRFFEPLSISWLIKLLPMLLLISVAASLASNLKEKFFVLGLIFSTIGDLLLELDKGQLFIYGLGSFFVAHIFYISALLPINSFSVVKARLKFIVLYFGYGFLNLSLIYSNLADLLIPVVFYMSVLMILGLVTLLSLHSNGWLILGGISFIISDSLIGLNKFYADFSYAPIFIMLTYYMAQFALFKGMFYSQPRHIKNPT